MDLVGATNLVPGPNSTEMTMHCGYNRAGIAGLFVAGICFIFPAVVLTGLLAYFYVEYGELPAIAPFSLWDQTCGIGNHFRGDIQTGKKKP